MRDNVKDIMIFLSGAWVILLLIATWHHFGAGWIMIIILTGILPFCYWFVELFN